MITLLLITSGRYNQLKTIKDAHLKSVDSWDDIFIQFIRISQQFIVFDAIPAGNPVDGVRIHPLVW